MELASLIYPKTQISDSNAVIKEYNKILEVNSDLLNAKSALLLVCVLSFHPVLVFDDVTSTTYKHAKSTHFDLN